MSEARKPRPKGQWPNSHQVTVDKYRDDPLYPKIVAAVAKILATSKSVAPIDVLVGMGLLEKDKLEDWRFGRVPYLEKVISGNLTKLSRLLRILRFHGHDLHLGPSLTVYVRWGKGPKTPLRFTKTGDQPLERAYATHLVWPGKGPFHPPRQVAVHEAPPGSVPEAPVGTQEEHHE